MNAAQHEPSDREDPDTDQGLRPIADEEADHLRCSGAKKIHAITGLRLRIIITARRDAPK